MLLVSPAPDGRRRQETFVAFAFDRLLADVARSFGLAPDSLSGSGRGPAQAALARQVAMYLGHVALGMSYEEIGRLTGRHRTTVAHACRAIEDRRDEGAFDAWVESVEHSLFASALRRIEAKAGRQA